MLHIILKVNGKVAGIGLNSAKLKYIRKQVSSKPADTRTCTCIFKSLWKYTWKDYNLENYLLTVIGNTP